MKGENDVVKYAQKNKNKAPNTKNSVNRTPDASMGNTRREEQRTKFSKRQNNEQKSYATVAPYRALVEADISKEL